jgi:hypothetical protein
MMRKDLLMTFFGYDPHFLDVNAGALVSSVHFDKRQKICQITYLALAFWRGPTAFFGGAKPRLG